jgi:hypothetical protein
MKPVREVRKRKKVQNSVGCREIYECGSGAENRQGMGTEFRPKGPLSHLIQSLPFSPR